MAGAASGAPGRKEALRVSTLETVVCSLKCYPELYGFWVEHA